MQNVGRDSGGPGSLPIPNRQKSGVKPVAGMQLPKPSRPLTGGLVPDG